MAASPMSAAATSELEAPSSPAPPINAPQVFRPDDDEDDDDDDTAQLNDASPDPVGKPTKGRKSQGKENSHQVGKIRHLKKEDGEPLWREDIQYDFLRAVFDNDRRVFTNSYHGTLEKQCFADLYIDTMARSSKTSKVLRDKLLSDREAAKGMAMVCLLVNMNRMNTTLNFFPEMRAQLRTYHAIPSLQAHQDPHAYKQLQDAPRLKSILKGGAEDRIEPSTLESIKDLDVPRTNPVNLIFVMCSQAPKIAELHFPDGDEFHDLIMKTQFSSSSRAMAFLWLMWFYLESDFTEEGCDENPFGPGVDYGVDVANQGVPRLQQMTDEEKAKENVDTEEEIEFGKQKQKTRAKILEMDNAYLHERETKRGKTRPSMVDDGPAILPRIRPSKHENSDIDSTRSTPPPRHLGRAAGQSARRSAALKYQIFEGSSPAHQTPEGVVARKPRPPTAHQLAVERNRNQRVEYILEKGLRRTHRRSRRIRKQDGAIFRAYKRGKADEDPFENSDGEEPMNVQHEAGKEGVFRERGIHGLCLMMSEKDDYGEEGSAYAAAIRRTIRRLTRWHGKDNLGVIAPVRRPKQNGDGAGDEGKKDEAVAADQSLLIPNGDSQGDVTMGDAEAEDNDQTMLGDDEERGDDDKTEVMGDSDIE